MNEWLLGILGVLIGVGIGGGLAAWLLVRRAGLITEQLRSARSRTEILDAQNQQIAAELERVREAHQQADDARELAVRDLATVNVQLRQRDQQFAEQKKLLEDAERKLSDTFASLSSKALSAASDEFLKLAQQRFQILMTDARGDGEKRQQAIDSLVKPIRELLEKQNAAVSEIEKKREVAYKGLEEQIRHISTSHEKLNSETSRLVSALRRPEQRGRWGEMQLRNVCELAGMSAHCDFCEQPQTDDPETRDRPDLTVRMPGGGIIVVDSKVALDAYLDAIEREGADRAPLLKRHADQVELHYKRLAHKRYWDQFERTPKLVVMFMPLESALVAALEVKPDLHADAMRNHVLIATPTLLIALLRAVAYGWQQEALAENAREISAVGRELYDRVAQFAEHFQKVGKGIEHATRAYNSAVGTLERRVLPSTRKLKELHATTEPEIDAPDQIDREVRAFASAELKPVRSDSDDNELSLSDMSASRTDED